MKPIFVVISMLAVVTVAGMAGCQKNEVAQVEESAEQPVEKPAERLSDVGPQATLVALATSSTEHKIEPFALQDYLGAEHSSVEWSDKQAVVVVFLGVECPLAKLYGQRLAEMAKKYEPLGVQFVGINSNRQDTLAEMAHYARVHQVDFPLLKDPGQKVAGLFSATRTPEAFVLDSEGVVQYQGRIDDQYGVGYSRDEPEQKFIVDVLDQLLADKPVALAETEAVGCLIGRAPQVDPTGDITYSNQISRLVQNRCVSCHRKGQIAPFTLTSYDDVTSWGEMMREVIDEGRMPPWHADPKYGEFSNDCRMPAEEKEMFAQWLENGQPEGDPADLPELPEYVEGWQIPKPTVIYKIPAAYEVPAKGTVDYQYFTVDPGFTEDMWVVAAEARPGNRAVVHHLILFYVPPEQKRVRGQDALFNMIVGFAPGTPPMIAKAGLATRIPAGSKLVFQLHYTPNGSPQTDLSEVGLVFVDKKEVVQEMKVSAAMNFRFQIPPGADNHRVSTTFDVPYDAKLLALTPHMHYRGKSFKISATYPDGKVEILLDVPEYDFNWQNSYAFANPKQLPSGTKLKMVAHFDNSTGNLANPDPTATVTWGDQTWEEMMLGTMMLTRDGQDLRLGAPEIKAIEGEKSRVRFRYRPDEPVENVYLAGTFNDWKETGHAMEGPDDEGRYTTTLDLEAGKYEYKFVLDGKTWKTDPGNDQHEGFFDNSVVRVE